MATATTSLSSPCPSSSASVQPEAIPPIGYLSRKALPIKRGDAEALTRSDVQYDLLHHIFSSTIAVFTPQTPGSSSKITFSQLYINALYHSSKCSKVLKDKMVETPAFATELAKISLLTNVGRINTTMAFFPEMKTALRTYHPVPSLQKTDGNAQDAPRIKNCLKAALLPSELKSPPATPEEIMQKNKAGFRPPTAVVNLIFVLANHAAPLAAVHFEENINFLDLFLPKPLSSADRARSFLWHMYHYLEDPTSLNPFDDDFSRQHHGKSPLIHQLSLSEKAKENVDTYEELEWARKMSAERNLFLQRLISSMRSDRKSQAPHFVPAVPDASNLISVRSRGGRRETSSNEVLPFMYYVPGRSDPATPPPRSSTGGNLSRFLPESEGPSLVHNARPVTQRTMLQQAWHMVLNSDPLLDSDEENPDEHIRLDYSKYFFFRPAMELLTAAARRLNVITSIRRRPLNPNYDEPGRSRRT